MSFSRVWPDSSSPSLDLLQGARAKLENLPGRGREVLVNQNQPVGNHRKHHKVYDKTWQTWQNYPNPGFLISLSCCRSLWLGPFHFAESSTSCFCPTFSLSSSGSMYPVFLPMDLQENLETRASLGTKRNRIWMLHRAWPNQSCVRCCVSVCHVKNENCYGAGSMASLSCELQFLSGHPLTASSKLAGPRYPRSISVVILFRHPPHRSPQKSQQLFSPMELYSWIGLGPQMVEVLNYRGRIPLVMP